jgi:adenine-specific DNA methylase
MNIPIEQSVKDVISKKLEEGFVEAVIAEQLENGVKNALKDLFGTYGEVTKIIKKEVTSVMIPYLEKYDYSGYITKLDEILVDILKNTALDNKKILENFKELMAPEDRKTIKATELFEQWMKHVAEHVETNGLDIDYDDEPTYESVEVRMEVDQNNDRSWSDFKRAILVFECEHDENMNYEIPIHRWKDINKNDEWTIDYKAIFDLSSLRSLNKFDIFLMKLVQGYTRLVIDSEYETDEVELEARPEATFS